MVVVFAPVAKVEKKEDKPTTTTTTTEARQQQGGPSTTATTPAAPMGRGGEREGTTMTEGGAAGQSASQRHAMVCSEGDMRDGMGGQCIELSYGDARRSKVVELSCPNALACPPGCCGVQVAVGAASMR